MSYVRSSIADFSLANAYYAAATVTVYEANAYGERTTVLAPLYEAITGSAQLTNPQTLSSLGKFIRPVYVDRDVVVVVTGNNIETHETGVITTYAFTDYLVDPFTGDGTTTVFTLSRLCATASLLDVTIDGARQKPDAGYTVNGTTSLTFSEAPPAGAEIFVVHSATPAPLQPVRVGPQGPSGNGGIMAVKQYTGTGVQTAFDLEIDGVDNVIIAIDGVLQPPSSYSLAGRIITFTQAPPNLAIVDVRALGNLVGMVLDYYTAPYTGAVPRTVSSKMGDVVSVKDFEATGGGVAIDGAKIQLALTAVGNAGGGIVFVPRGTYLIDVTLQVPAYTHLIGEGDASVIKVVGYDTHARNSAIFLMFQSSATQPINNPCAIAIEGSYASVQNLKLDGNGRNNYYPNVDYGGSPNDWLLETLRMGVSGIRIGGLNYRASVGVAARIIYGSFVRDCSLWNCSWGAVSIQGQVMNKVIGGGDTEDQLYGCHECGVYDCHFERNNSNTVQINGAVDATVRGCTLISTYHTAVKCYTRVNGATIADNTVLCDDARQWCWDPRYTTVAEYREKEQNGRSEMLCVGHSDYDTVIKNVFVINNKVRGNSVGVLHGVLVYGGAENIKVCGNDITGTVFGVSFTFPHSVLISENKIRSASYQQIEASGTGTTYGGADITLFPRSGEVAKTVSANPSITIANNALGGAGVSNIRFSNFTKYTDLTLTPAIRAIENDCDLTSLAAFGATALDPVLVGATSPGLCLFRGNTFVKLSALATYAQVFTTIGSGVTIRDTFEGTFTPTAIGDGTAGAGTYSSQLGSYILHNGRVDFECSLAWSAHTGTGNIRISGLPYTCRAGGPAVPVALVASGLTFGTGGLVGHIAAGTSYVNLLLQATATGTASIAMDTVVGALRISGSYPI